MTAHRIVTDHTELDNVGQLTHQQIDDHINNDGWLVVSGSAGPHSARKLVAGPGITFVDTGPGGELIVSVTSGSNVSSNVSWSEVPAGTIDGFNQTFVLANEPMPSASLMFFYNGVLLEQGPDNDYVVSGSVVSMLFVPRANSKLCVTYPF